MAKSLNPDTVWQPFGAFSQIVVAGEGKTVYLKGQVALDPDGNIVGEGDMNTQVRRVLENIHLLLHAVGGRISDIVSLVQYTTDIQAFMQAGSVRQEFFSAPFPVTTTVEVAALYDQRLLVEITAIAEVPLERFVNPSDGVEMHG